MALRPVSVTQLNEYISRILTTDPLLCNISVKGEISNLKYHSSGHIYFSIIDQSSKINCFMANNYVRNLNYSLDNGLEITIHGYINVYKKGGTYTLFVRSIDVAGEGNLSVAFQILKDKLEKEGLFDKQYKKPLPRFPHKLGVITSETGAAVNDIIKIIKQRTSLTDIIVFPVLVQGPDAGRDIASMLKFVNEKFNDIDLLIVGRGGGSTEDLWAFNEECVARAIFESVIPVISAVGHEIDFTIADFVADKRAETPTAAAEMAVPDTKSLAEEINAYKDNLTICLQNKLKYDKLAADNYILNIKNYFNGFISDASRTVERYKIILEENNPAFVLRKGYSIIENENGNIVKYSTDVIEGERYRIIFEDGSVVLTASDVKRKVKVD